MIWWTWILCRYKTCLTLSNFFVSFQSLFAIVAQFPVFISFFFAIRGMANLPVESFKTGGYLWFQDLTLCDPYYVLPIMCSFSMLASLEVRKMCFGRKSLYTLMVISSKLAIILVIAFMLHISKPGTICILYAGWVSGLFFPQELIFQISIWPGKQWTWRAT